MSGQPQLMVRRVGIDFAKQLRRCLGLVTADSESHDAAIFVTNREFGHTLSFLRPKLTHRVKNPQQGDSEVPFATLPPPLQAFEYRGKVLLAPQVHAYRNVDLRVQYVF